MIIKIDDNGLGDSTARALQVHDAVIRDAARHVVFMFVWCKLDAAHMLRSSGFPV
jgi:hypothetical protein